MHTAQLHCVTYMLRRTPKRPPPSAFLSKYRKLPTEHLTRYLSRPSIDISYRWKNMKMLGVQKQLETWFVT